MPFSPKLQTNDLSEKNVRVTISEAARLFGVNPRTIRRAIASGELRYIIVCGRYKLHFGSLVSWSQRAVTVRHKRDARGIGQWVEQWKIRNPKFSPREPN
ncbi:MAG: helix-turn-helix domain-containing protein [Patescibacteria group bacterium]